MNKAIEVAEEFKTSTRSPAPKAAVKFNEEELAQEVKKDEEILADLAKQVLTYSRSSLSLLYRCVSALLCV